MAKKKKQKATRKKEGAAAKTSSHSTTNERRATNADFQLFHSIDEGMPLFSQTIVQDANHHIQNQSLGSKEQERLLKKMDAIYNKDVGDWVLTLYTTIITGEFYSLGPYTRVVFDKLVFLVKNAISATKKKDVLINGMEIQIVICNR
ncbi:predicted protein [Chaetoceros tenuissimus]|uniref:Uncharacterized protein n=1 Tax=Chaetoceros tenuissimus TaxID=426638 RepID=A0AAD3D028_9STRA|nr:predicted protein [Chaetoceros tenuissimus]